MPQFSENDNAVMLMLSLLAFLREELQWVSTIIIIIDVGVDLGCRDGKHDSPKMTNDDGSESCADLQNWLHAPPTMCNLCTTA